MPNNDASANGGRVPYTRAASVLDYAIAADHETARALEEPHVALDAYGRILGISTDVARRLGFPSSRLVGRRLRHRVLGADRAHFQATLAQVRDGRMPEPFELRLRAKDEKILLAKMTPVAMTRTASAMVLVVGVTFMPPVPAQDGFAAEATSIEVAQD